MNRFYIIILTASFFTSLSGCSRSFAQDSKLKESSFEAPKTPKAPQAPVPPQSPEAPEVLKASKVLKAPEAPKARTITQDKNTIKLDHINGQREYSINGKAYKWSNLSEAQQSRILEVEKRMQQAEAKFARTHENIQPILAKLETKLEKFHEIARELDVDPATTTVKELEEKVRAHSVKLRAVEASIQDEEELLREYESEAHKQAKAFEVEMKRSTDQIINILKNR